MSKRAGDQDLDREMNKRLRGESSSSDAEGSSADGIRRFLLGENGKERRFNRFQLISFLFGALAAPAPAGNPDLLARIRSDADSDPLNRQIVVSGPGLLKVGTKEGLEKVFSCYGAIEDCHLDIHEGEPEAEAEAEPDGFVRFSTRSAAWMALKWPKKSFSPRPADWKGLKYRVTREEVFYCWPAKPQPPRATFGSAGGRRVHVTNVPPGQQCLHRLWSFFSENFGEIKSGPTVCSGDTPYRGGQRWSHVAIVFKSSEVASKVVQRPSIMFQGRQIHCQLGARHLRQAARRGGRRGFYSRIHVIPQDASKKKIWEREMRRSKKTEGLYYAELTKEEEDDDNPSPDRILCLLELFTYEQIILYLSAAASADQVLLNHIFSIAHSTDGPCRKILVHGLPLDIAQDKLISFFAEFGEIEDGPKILKDCITGTTGGSATIVYKTWAEANKALEEPGKMLEGNFLVCHRESSAPFMEGELGARVAAAAWELASRNGKEEFAVNLEKLTEFLLRALRDGDERNISYGCATMVTILSGRRPPEAMPQMMHHWKPYPKYA